MADNDINPYAAPNPIEEPKRPPRPAATASAVPDSLITKPTSAGTILWWFYCVICGAIFVWGLNNFIRLALRFQFWDILISPMGFTLIVQGLAVIGLIGYLSRVPLFHSFFWGLVCLGYLGLSIYSPAMAISFVNSHDGTLFTQQFFGFIGMYLLRLPELYALWRYSSSSSPVWREPRIQWKALSRKLVDAIIYLRRA